MSNTMTKPTHTVLNRGTSNASWAGRISAFIAAFICLLAAVAQADTTMAITTQPPLRIFAAAGYTNVYPNYQTTPVAFSLTGDTNVIDLYVNVSGAPAGVTVGFVTNTFSSNAASIITFLQVTNTTSAWLSVAVSNAPVGKYTLTLIASNEFNGAIVTADTLLVLPNAFIAQVGSVDTNWSSGANWSAGTIPVAGDSVKFEYPSAPSRQVNTYSDTSITLDSLTLLPRTSALFVTNWFAPNVTIAISGSNGFWSGADLNPATAANGLLNATFIGASGALIVTNPEASFSMFSGNNDGGGTSERQSMSGLGTLITDVRRFGLGDGELIYPNISYVGTKPAQNGIFELARTNIIRATYVGDYSGFGRMTNSIMFMNNNGNNNGNFGSQVLLGISNVFYADSISAIDHGSGNANSVFKFNPVFANSNAVAIFRGTNGGRMSFFGVGMESGTNTITARTRGAGADFTLGKVDMLVDTIWLAHNSTNFSGGNQQIGNLLFSTGIVDVNVLRAGYKQWTNSGLCQATITVGGSSTATATLKVNSLLELGHCDIPMLETVNSPGTFGRLVINTNGVATVDTIIAGAGSVGDSITINNGGKLIVTNTIGTAGIPLPALTMQGFGQMTLNVTAGITNVYVTNFTDAVIGGTFHSTINIATMTGISPSVASTNVVIQYITAASHNFTIGTVPPGYNNIILFDNTSAKTIELRVSPNAPQVLRWKGYINNVWDHLTDNWQNTNTLAHVKFNDADSVIFEDIGAPTNVISVTEDVVPNPSGTGIYMTNSAPYAFENGGSGQIESCTMVKEGSGDLTNNVTAGANVQFTAGTLYGAGAFGNLTLYTNTVMSFSGKVNGSMAVNNGAKATLLSGGELNSGFSISGGGVFTNYGTVKGGSLSVSTNGLLVNPTGGWLKSIGGSASINGTLLNSGDIGAALQNNVMTVSGTFKDMGLGNIYLVTLTFNAGAHFLPGGDGIGTTEIKSPGVGGSFPGRLTMLAGSTTLINVDLAGTPQSNTMVVASYTDFGGNTSVKAYDGCTILMTNINIGGGSLAAGQSFRVFTGPSSIDIGNEGLNTTNRYPIVIPVVPAVNTKWDLSQLRDPSPNGFLNLVYFPTTATNVTLVSSSNDGTNVVTHLQWPADYIGWSLQQQTNSLSVGLQNITSKWVVVSGSTATNDIYITNSVAIPASFFRMAYP